MSEIDWPRAVAVYKVKKDTHFQCHRVYNGWKCGNCRAGNLGILPKVGDACRVCHATVTEVRTDRTPQ